MRPRRCGSKNQESFTEACSSPSDRATAVRETFRLRVRPRMVARRIAGHIRTRVRSGLMLALKSGYIVYSPLMLKLKMGFGFLLSILLITAGLGFSQTGTGNIQGVVKDATGAVVPNATVTIVHTATGGQNKTQTNEVGFYFFPSIQVGEYQISVESAGMDAWKGALSLLAGQSAVVEPVLKLGTTATAVTVAGDVTPLITTTSPTVATVVEHTRIEQLPLNGRNITTLLYMTVPGLESGSVPRNYGLRYATEMLQDGAILENREWQSIPARPPGLDTIEEFRAETLNSSAKMNRPGTFILTTRSGTNRS